MPTTPIDEYRRQIERELQAGNATEHTHRPALKALIESLASGVTATNEPKHRTDCGAPDILVSRGTKHGLMRLGYIEAKDVDKDLSEAEKSDQLKRYFRSLHNLILTDYLEFRWYVDGEHRQTKRLARVSKGGKLLPEKDGAEAVGNLLAEFLDHEAEEINTPKELALRMARLTHFIRDMIVTAFETQSASATLRDLHKAFEKALIPDLPIPQFADMFAQTLAYGLFAARVNHHGLRGSFKRLGAAAEIPKTNPFLRQLFESITGTALDDEPFVGFVDDLAQLLADTEIDVVLADFGKRTAREDPVVHFYETFLAAYDPKMREARGVYYTPEPVVSYIVRSVDYLLKTRFGCAGGLADTATVEYEREEEDASAVEAGLPRQTPGDVKSPLRKATAPRVLILDPACGTGTFLYAVVDHIRSEFMRQGNAGMWSGYVRNHLLPRIFGFELLMAPYAVAHFKLGMQLAGHDLTPAQREKWAYDFSGEERLGVFLTNTLEEAERRAETLFGPLRVISQEANAALKIKSELPILAVIGNPPYSNFGQMNNGDWITGLMREWKPQGEKKWNPDDFMKFMRWAQWRIERTGSGILAFVTNNTYIDGITRRRMRETLLKIFSEIYVLNLHGSSRKGEISPSGSKDKNVFDIRQGVAIGIFVRQPGKSRATKVSYCDLWGLREDKYRTLFETDVSTTQWLTLTPQADQFFFVPIDFSLQSEYEKFAPIDGSIFPQSNAGIQTKRDRLIYHFSQEQLGQVLDDIRNLSAEALTQKYELPPDGRDWAISWAKRDIEENKGQVIRVQYRPFDVRVAYCTGKTKGLMAYPRFPLMASALKSNLLLLTVRNPRKGNVDSFLVGNTAVDKDAVSPFDNVTFFPLYLYPPPNEGRGQRELGEEILRWPQGPEGRRPNLSPEYVADLEKRLRFSFVSDGKGDLKKTFGPEDVFNYIYAILHSPTYRARYAEFLKSDFPRVPLTSDVKLFRSLCGSGAELVALHLLESPRLAKAIARFPVNGSNLVEKGFPKYFPPGEPEPVFVEAASRRQTAGGVNPPLRSPLPRLKEGRVYISRSDPQTKTEGQYFEGVPPQVWNFHIGGYQVCEKWLKDRRGRSLTYGDLEHYRKVVTALNETICLMAEIDAAIPGWPIE